jgi:NAD(P)H-hydrate repair Nnr-like enzyme with NAD(P)H-hydrate dehydratase domain
VAVLASERPLVIDGDALTNSIVESVTRRRALTILTPHTAEFDRMFGPSPEPKADRTIAAATVTGAWIVHKGADTVVASPRGGCWIETETSPWLSTAGTGDVLAGLIAARLAVTGKGEAAIEGVWLHTRVADLAGPAFIADDLIAFIPQAIAECLQN